MRHCLFIAYEFSTKHIGGSIRAIKFAQYLPQHGWIPHVVTATPPEEHPDFGHDWPGSLTYSPSPERDYGGGTKIEDEGLSVLEQNPWWLRRLAFVKQLLPLERQLVWYRNLRRDAWSAVSGVSVEVVLSTSAPYVVMLFGRWLASRLGVHHVVDIRDDWVDWLKFNPRSWVSRQLLEAYTGWVARRTVAMTVPTQLVQARMHEAYGIPVHVIRNGYDEPHFAHVPLAAEAVDPAGPLRLVHLGWLGEFRSLAPLLDVLAEDDELSAAVHIDQYGLVEPDQPELVAARGMEDCVTFHPHLEHAEVIDQMARADVLLLLQGYGLEGAIPGKLFEYLRARRPILLHAIPGAAMDLAASVGARWCVPFGDRAMLRKTLHDLLAQKRAGTLRTHTDAAEIRAFSREATASMLADVLGHHLPPAAVGP